MSVALCASIPGLNISSADYTQKLLQDRLDKGTKLNAQTDTPVTDTVKSFNDLSHALDIKV